MIAAYPLSWPDGWPRTKPINRRRGRFGASTERMSYSGHTYTARNPLSVAQASHRVMEAIRKLGAVEPVIISTNIPVRQDGRPRSGQRRPDDPGVAVYWKQPGDTTHKVIAIDHYAAVEDNLAAVAATLEAMRAIERHGGARILARAFTGFQALPSPDHWRHVLNIDGTPSWDDVVARYRHLAKANHPDVGGSEDGMARLNRAYHDARLELHD